MSTTREWAIALTDAIQSAPPGMAYDALERVPKGSLMQVATALAVEHRAVVRERDRGAA